VSKRQLVLGAVSLAGILVASGAAGLVANRVADTSTDDLPVLVGTLAATGILGLAAAWLVQRWTSAFGFAARVLIFTGLGIGVFIANMAIAASMMFISTHDLRLLLVLCGYALAAASIPALAMGRSLGQRLGKVEQSAQRIAEGDFAVRVNLHGNDDIARLAHAFDTMAARLEKADANRASLERSRRDLFAAISHDLRTPLSSIRVMVEALTDRVVTDPATTDRYLGMMTGDIERLSLLIDDLFELARIDSGALQLRLQETEIGGVVESAVAGVVPIAEKARVAVSCGPTAAATLLADPERLTRVLGNLLQNAIRHTPADGSVVVTTSATGSEVVVSVADTGNGIPPGDVSRVFERFYRAEKSRSRTGGGSGLGLSIAKSIVEAHGGRIWIDQTGSAGTTVSFALPAR
jgi:signal transduction histidine kinase